MHPQTLALRVILFSLPLVKSQQACKVFPGDPSWPDDSTWSLLNQSTGGAVIKTIPIAAPCYPGLFYNSDECAYVTAQWTNSSLQ